MSINPKIFNAINELSVENENIKELLKELVLYETTNPGWYKDKYKELIVKYTVRLGDENEN